VLGEFQPRVGARRPGMDRGQAYANGIAALTFEQATKMALRGFGNLDHGAILRFETGLFTRLRASDRYGHNHFSCRHS
jgi:hypothetical protein